MSNVFFISDLHFGHKRITEFQGASERLKRLGDDYIENAHIIINNWNKVVSKKDLVWVLGDVAFSQEGFEWLKELKGRKKLVRGNHDNYFPTKDWLSIFETVEGITNYKGYWLSHCPIHPQEIRNRLGNIHGHTHSNLVVNQYTGEWDRKYINVCVEWTRHIPISFDMIKSGEYQKCFEEK